MRKVVKSVASATSVGAAKNPASAVDVEAMLGKSLAGMDAALLQAVEANRKALAQFVGSGVALSEKPLKEALANVEQMEDTFFSAIGKAGKLAGPLQDSWEHALSSLQLKGSETGMQAEQTVEALMAQAQTALRDSRATGMRAAKAMLDSYSAMVSGVLLGMSEGLTGAARQPPPRRRPRRVARRRKSGPRVAQPERPAAMAAITPATLAATAGSLLIGRPHSRLVSPGHLLVASSPILPPRPETGEAKSR